MPNPSTPTGRLVFACMAASGRSEIETLTLAGSIRAFAEEFSNNPIWVLIPETADRISEAIRERLLSLDARLIPFEIDQAALEFPFAAKVYAAAAAEPLARGQTDFLAWMDSDSIVIRSPRQLLLQEGKNLGTGLWTTR
jgi:hypothetical protein